ncbi:hypothetical protein GBF38_014788 [Nibea albiflora]|uniref:Uncharacterized protein n=1 Tax=Nibea albiflora TaxID=240163 RepID=A0ACB7EK27_NIBAL|nr:hypothetical protein GBF38_014788 [Nibea albiflora]
MRLLRWADRLNQYNFSLDLMPGRANRVADPLSRVVSVTKKIGGSTSDMESDKDWVHILHGPLSTVVTLTKLQQASAANIDHNLLPYCHFGDELSCWGAVCLTCSHRAVVPEILRGKVVHMAHKGHLGVVKVKQRCWDTVWWPHMDSDGRTLPAGYMTFKIHSFIQNGQRFSN